MVKPNLSIKINLTPAEKESIKSVFFKWVINVGKIIIIVVQLIAMGALFYRFTLDRKIADIHDQIQRKEALVKAQEENEKEYRSLQKRLAEIKTASTETQIKVDTVNKILPQIKQDNFLIKRFALKENLITLEIEVSSVFVIPALVNGIKEISNVDSIKIANVNSQDNLTEFTMDINLKNKLAGNLQETSQQLQSSQ